MSEEVRMGINQSSASSNEFANIAKTTILTLHNNVSPTPRLGRQRSANEIADAHFTLRVFNLFRAATDERKAQRQKGFGRLCRAWDGWAKVVEDGKEARRKEDVAMGHWRIRLKADALLSMRSFALERRKIKRKEEIAGSLWRNKVR